MQAEDNNQDRWPEELALLVPPPPPSRCREEARKAALAAFRSTGGASHRRLLPALLAASFCAIALAFGAGLWISGQRQDPPPAPGDLATLLHQGQELFGPGLAGFILRNGETEWHLVAQKDPAPTRVPTSPAYHFSVADVGGAEAILVLRTGFPVELDGKNLELMEGEGPTPIIVGDSFLWQGGTMVGGGPEITNPPVILETL